MIGKKERERKKSTLLSDQADLFQSRTVSELCTFIHFFQCKATRLSDYTHLVSLKAYFMLHRHLPSLGQ